MAAPTLIDVGRTEFNYYLERFRYYCHKSSTSLTHDGMIVWLHRAQTVLKDVLATAQALDEVGDEEDEEASVSVSLEDDATKGEKKRRREEWAAIAADPTVKANFKVTPTPVLPASK